MLLTPFEIFQAAFYRPLNPHWQPEKPDYCNCTVKADMDTWQWQFKSFAQKVEKADKKEEKKSKVHPFQLEAKSKVRVVRDSGQAKSNTGLVFN